MAILGGMMLVLGEVLQQTNRFYILNRARHELQAEARGIMETVNRNLRQAKTSSIKIDRATSSQPYYSRVSFTDVNNTNYVIYQDNKKLKLTAGTVTDRVLSNNIRYLAFSFPKSDDLAIISVAMTLEKTISLQKRQYALHMASEKIRVMNE